MDQRRIAESVLHDMQVEFFTGWLDEDLKPIEHLMAPLKGSESATAVAQKLLLGIYGHELEDRVWLRLAAPRKAGAKSHALLALVPAQ